MQKPMAFAILLLAAGTASAQVQPIPTPLYPLKVGARWTYIVTSGKDAPAKEEVKKVTVEVERPEVYIRKTKGADGKDVEIKNTGFILMKSSGAKVTRDHVVVLEDGFYTVHVAGTQINPPVCNIKITKDWAKGWEADSKSGNTTVKGSFTVRLASVKVPAGTFEKAYLISFTNNIIGDDRVEIDCWYVVDVGMVRQRVLQKGREIILDLEKYEPAK